LLPDADDVLRVGGIDGQARLHLAVEEDVADLAGEVGRVGEGGGAGDLHQGRERESARQVAGLQRLDLQPGFARPPGPRRARPGPTSSEHGTTSSETVRSAGIGRGNGPGAQTGRRGVAGLVRVLLRGWDPQGTLTSYKGSVRGIKDRESALARSFPPPQRGSCTALQIAVSTLFTVQGGDPGRSRLPAGYPPAVAATRSNPSSWACRAIDRNLRSRYFAS